MKEMSTGKIVAGVFFGLFLFFVVLPMAMCGGCTACVGMAGIAGANGDTASRPSPSFEAPVSVPDTPPAPAVDVELKELLEAYKGNEVRADGAYKDKTIRTSGRVDDVKKDILDEVYMTVGTGKPFEIPQVQCFVVAEDLAKASALNKGDKVTIEGDVDGLMMNVLVRNCRIQ